VSTRKTACLKAAAFDDMRNVFTFRSHSGRFTGAMFCAWGDPARGNIHGGVDVGVNRTAGCTREHIAASGSQGATRRTGLRGIGRFDVFDFDSTPFGLVGHEALQWDERPARDHAAGMFVPDPGSLPNMRKPFPADHSALCAFGFGNDSLAQIVVLPGDAAALPPGESTQGPTRPPIICTWRPSLLLSPSAVVNTRSRVS
jgi:hypothetical protein